MTPWRPFLDPMPMETGWLLFLPPLIVAVALVQRLIKAKRLRDVPREAARLCVQVFALLGVAAGSLWLLLWVR
ncbi:MAG: hypothetical protein AAF288_08005 [Planctomycetota bacterium]